MGSERKRRGGQREYWEAGHQEPSGHMDKGLGYTGEEQLGGRDGLGLERFRMGAGCASQDGSSRLRRCWENLGVVPVLIC